MAHDREILTWADFGTSGEALAQLVRESGFRPDLLLCVARGGLFPGGALAYRLDVKNVHLVNVEFYTGVDSRLPTPVVLPPLPATADLAGAQVLVVDDVADTGGTLAVVRDLCAPLVAQARIAVLYEKPTSTVRCDYVWRRTDRWIDFPWSS